MKPSAVLVLVLATSAGASLDVAAKETARPVDTTQRMLDRMDRNVDDKISIEEFRNAMTRRFDARDKDKNGVLEGAEIPKPWRVDADTALADGKLTQEAFAAALLPVFDRFDGNHDGQLDRTEIANYAAARRAPQEATP